ncbi:WbqC family protein [Shewanella waksmanii]|uniref:WbqC family protein n=1 Tax=Shewanella waksmanii TaxID=213783 RepID=UPI003736E304
MKLGIMQPYFFPYLGYFQLINHVDRWVVFDEVQYNKKSWMNRNRVVHPDIKEDYQYISVPICKHAKGTLIREAMINNQIGWREALKGKLTVYKHLGAKNYGVGLDLVSNVIDRDVNSFLDLSTLSIKAVCKYLDINIHSLENSSDIHFDRSSVDGPGDWALMISKAKNATQYINPYGGRTLFDEGKYSREGIELNYLRTCFSEYKQGRDRAFVRGLSVIDLIMFLDKEEISNLLREDFFLVHPKDVHDKS